MITGFIDESGTLAPDPKSDFYTVALLTAHDVKRIEVLIRRLRQSLHRRERTSELKAARSHPRVIHRLLNGLAELECEIYVLVIDKAGISVSQSEAIYRAAISGVVQHCVKRHPEIHLILDKRYTKRSQQTEIERVIRLGIAQVPGQVVLIDQLESWSSPGLQAVDFVAWAFQQKHAANEPWAAQIIAQKVLVEERVKGIKIAALPRGR